MWKQSLLLVLILVSCAKNESSALTKRLKDIPRKSPAIVLEPTDNLADVLFNQNGIFTICFQFATVEDGNNTRVVDVANKDCGVAAGAQVTPFKLSEIVATVVVQNGQLFDNSIVANQALGAIATNNIQIPDLCTGAVFGLSCQIEGIGTFLGLSRK